jgi:pro-sigmaK processing inhibitor BofA
MGKTHLLGILMIAFVFLFLLGGIVLPGMGLLGSIVINSIVGVMLLFLANIIGIKIPINPLTLLIVLIFGLAGLALLALLALFGIYDGPDTPRSED